VILIMTTNAGAADMAKPAIGFEREAKREGDDTEAINRMFTPEFRNRLDAVIPFAGLPDVVSRSSKSSSCSSKRSLAERGRRPSN
jgi:ATP-dependent Clp protease ATP-binding subunit ClpA